MIETDLNTQKSNFYNGSSYYQSKYIKPKEEKTIKPQMICRNMFVIYLHKYLFIKIFRIVRHFNIKF